LELGTRLPELPPHSREAVEQELATLDFLETQIESAEQRLEAIMKVSVEADVLQTLPCVGKILSMVLMLEIGRIDRFPTAAHLASYAGLVPRVRSSGGHTRMGQVCSNVNRNLKWAFVETGNLIVINQRRLAGNSRRAAVPTDQTQQKSPEGGGRSGAPLGRSSLECAHQARSLSRAVKLAAAGSFVDARVSALKQLAHRG
jgi:transposase